MLRTTLMIPPALKARAQQRARELGISVGELIRRALEAELSSSKSGSRSDDPLFTDQTVFDGESPSDLAENHDRYLYGEDAS